MLFAVNTSDPTDLHSSTNPSHWLDEVWCDIRVHYSKQSDGTVSVSLGEVRSVCLDDAKSCLYISVEFSSDDSGYNNAYLDCSRYDK